MIMKKGIEDFYSGVEYTGTITIDGQEYRFGYEVRDGYLDGCCGIEVVKEDGDYEEANDEITNQIGALVMEKIKTDGTFRLNNKTNGLITRLENIRMVAKHSGMKMDGDYSYTPFPTTEDPADATNELWRMLKVISYFTNTGAAVNGGGYIGPAEMKNKDKWSDLELNKVV